MKYLPYLFAILLAGLGYWVGKTYAEKSYQAQKIKTQQELFDVSEKLSEANTKLEKYRAAQENLARELEQQALDAPDAHRPGISVDGLQRLQRRWGTPD